MVNSEIEEIKIKLKTMDTMIPLKFMPWKC